MILRVILKMPQEYIEFLYFEHTERLLKTINYSSIGHNDHAVVTIEFN